MTTNNFHTRINDHALSFGIVRYSTGSKPEDHYLWKLVISEFCGSKKLAAIEVTMDDLQKIKSFCDKAIEDLKTDGGRIAV